MTEQREILHSSEGLEIWRNPKNQFVVARLHFRADPAKRSEKWLKEAQAGMTPEKFAREYCIDWTSILGAKVFPEFQARKTEIIVTDPLPDFGPDLAYWGGFDYGARNPSSFHVYTIADGCLYSVWELFKPCRNLNEYVAEMKQFPYWNKIRYIAADPKCWANDQQMEYGLVSIAERMFKEGVRNMVKGSQDESGWIALVHNHWAQEDPTFKIFNSCPNQIREFESCIYVNQSERQLLNATYREEIADHDNHSLDDAKYFMLTNPRARQAPQLVDSATIESVNRWAQNLTHRGSQGPLMPKSPIKGYM